jgi:hypothetical protein
MAFDLLTRGPGRFFRGNLHCHSTGSDGHVAPEDVVRAYRAAGYDFIMIADHFEARYGWSVTDTRHLRDESFTTIIGAELSSAAWNDRHAYWVAAAGLPLDMPSPPPGQHASAITQAADRGAFLVLLHPGLNNLPLAAVATLPGIDAIHAVEIYNHSMAMSSGSDRAYGTYLLEGLLEQGRRILVHAGDDAHFGHAADRFGGWVEVYCAQLDPDLLVASLKAGQYYSTQGPRLHELVIDGTWLHVASSDVYAISVTGSGAHWQNALERIGPWHGSVVAKFDLSPFIGSYCRVTAVDSAGRRAWSNPIWL